jgi:alpha-beta hydrolase superfamily lysophospholipase
MTLVVSAPGWRVARALAMNIQEMVFTAAVTCIARGAVLRDRALGRLSSMRRRAKEWTHPISRHWIASGGRALDAVLVRPAEEPRASLLICHGIGETVEYWTGVQHLLAAKGVASLVFDYSGYGRSRGPVDWRRCEEDSVAAFEYLKAMAMGAPVSLLGFSMGSGIATAILKRTQPERLVLCAAFTSFRDAACSMGVPRKCTLALPAIWGGEAPLRGCGRPVLIVHGQRDRTFPVTMARRLAEWAGPAAELVVAPGQRHKEPFYRPQMAFWGPVAEWLTTDVTGSDCRA